MADNRSLLAWLDNSEARDAPSADLRPCTRQERTQQTAAAAIERMLLKMPPLLRTWICPTRVYDENTSFIPYPKMTFLLDKPCRLVCGICLDSRIKMRPDDRRINDRTLCMLPCGHGAGYKCLKTWISTSDSCPFCRYKLKYPGCGHAIPPRPVTGESIHLLPRTLPDDGSVPTLCASCRREKYQKAAQERFKRAADEFQRARWCIETKHSSQDEITALRNEFENAVRDELHFKFTHSQMTSW